MTDRTLRVSERMAEEIQQWASDELGMCPRDTAYAADLESLLAQLTAEQPAPDLCQFCHDAGASRCTCLQPAPAAPKCWHPRTRHSMREGTVTCEVCGASISTFEPVPAPVASHETPVHVTQTGLSDTGEPLPPAPDAVAEAALRLLEIVEGINGAMRHGAWRDEKGGRLKDTPEWVAFYNAVKEASR